MCFAVILSVYGQTFCLHSDETFTVKMKWFSVGSESSRKPEENPTNQLLDSYAEKHRQHARNTPLATCKYLKQNKI